MVLGNPYERVIWQPPQGVMTHRLSTAGLLPVDSSVCNAPIHACTPTQPCKYTAQCSLSSGPVISVPSIMMWTFLSPSKEMNLRSKGKEAEDDYM